MSTISIWLASQVRLELRVQLNKSKLTKKSKEKPTMLIILKTVLLKPSQTEQFIVKLIKLFQNRNPIKKSIKFDFLTFPFFAKYIKAAIPASCNTIIAIR